MFSASSSSCESGYCCQNNPTANYRGTSYQCNWKNSFYPGLRQPIVYYAQIPLTKKETTKKNKKRNPNCFVKAFRWYTEEHVEDSGIHHTKNNPDLVGFATWLDTKYEQFVQENRTEPTGFNLSLNSSSIIETEKIRHQHVRGQHIVKKFARFRSPWRKRKPNKEAGDIGQKSNQSLKYILHPKDLTRPGSECLQISQTSYNNENPVRPIEIQESKKLSVKSLTCLCEQSKNVNGLLLSIQEGTVNETGLLNHKDNLYQNKALNPNVSLKHFNTNLIRNVSCQCSEVINKKNCKQIQYDNTQEKNNKMSANQIKLPVQPTIGVQLSCSKKCCKREFQTEFLVEIPKKGASQRTMSEFDPKHNVTCQCYEETLNIDGENEAEHTIRTLTSNYSNQYHKQSSAELPFQIEKEKQKIDALILEKFVTGTKSTSSFNILVNDAAQTSNCSMILEKDYGCVYPLFMRIIYPDKLDENIRN